MAVWSADENVDPIGACVGPKGQRVAAIVDELRGEKIDIIKWSEDPAQFIAAALAPSDVVSVLMAEEGKACRVIVPDDQLSLAIGKEGQNARLAAVSPAIRSISPESYQGEDDERRSWTRNPSSDTVEFLFSAAWLRGIAVLYLRRSRRNRRKARRGPVRRHV